MDEDWRNAFGILMCTEICDGAGAGICDGAPSTCSSHRLNLNADKQTYVCEKLFLTSNGYPKIKACILFLEILVSAKVGQPKLKGYMSRDKKNGPYGFPISG